MKIFQKRWPVAIGVTLMLLTLFFHVPTASASEEELIAAAEKLFALPDKEALCVITSDGENTDVYRLEPQSGVSTRAFHIPWQYDACYRLQNTLYFIKQEMGFVVGENRFVSELNIARLNLQDFEDAGNFPVSDVYTSKERVAFTPFGIVLIDNNAFDTLRFYAFDGTPKGTVQTPFDNLKIEGASSSALYLSHADSQEVYSFSLAPEEEELPAPGLVPLVGVEKPVTAVFDNLLFTKSGVYFVHPSDGTAMKKIDLGAELAAYSERFLHIIQDNNLNTFERETLQPLWSVETEGDVQELCATPNGVYVLSGHDAQRKLTFFSNDEMATLEPEALSGGRYISPTKAEQISRWKSLEKNLPAGAEALFAEIPAVTAPFLPGRMDTAALEQTEALLNYCRSMAGLKPLTVDQSGTESLQYGAVLLAANPAVLHNKRKPAGMTDAFFENGLQGLQTAEPIFLSKTHPLDALIGRLFSSTSEEFQQVFLHPQTTSFSVGFASGQTDLIALISLQTAADGGEERLFYTWPSAGDFPVEFAETLSHWTVTLDQTALRVRPLDVSVTVTGRGETWTAGVTVQENALLITPPEAVTEGDQYKIYIEGLERLNGRPVALTLDYDFFRLIQIFPESMTLYKRVNTEEGPALTPVTTDLTMQEGEAFELVCYLLPKNTTEKQVSFFCNHPEIVSVSGTGKVTACALGQALLTITAEGNLLQQVPVTVVKKPAPDPDSDKKDPLRIESDTYDIDHAKGLIYMTPPTDTAAQMRKKLSYSGDVFIRKPDGQLVSGAVGTGCTVELVREGRIVEILTVVLFGDVTGEGSVNTRDVTAVRRHLIKETLLQGPYLLAADVNHDLRISSLDILIITRYHLYRDSIPEF